jgi:hypothetical protein
VIGAPVMLVDSGTVPAAGGSWSPDLEKMQSATKDHIVIEEMRVWARSTLDTSQCGVGGWPLALLRASIVCGRNSLTNSYVPLIGLGPKEERYGAAEFTSAAPGSTPCDNANTMRWRFPRPMAIEAGTPFQPIFRWQDPLGNLAGSNDVQVTVAFIGRTIDTLPQSTCVPYASTYVARLNESESHDLDLMNICTKPINVAGLGIGLFCNPSGASQPADWVCDQLYTGSSWATSFFQATAGGVNDARFKLSEGGDQTFLVPQFASPAQVGGSRLWLPTSGYTIPKRGFLRVVQSTAPTTTDGLSVIALNGWREEAIQ